MITGLVGFCVAVTAAAICSASLLYGASTPYLRRVACYAALIWADQAVKLVRWSLLCSGSAAMADLVVPFVLLLFVAVVIASWRLDGADRPTLVIKGALASIPADNAVVVSWEERSISTLAPVAADGTFAAALAGKVGEAGCTIELLDAERRPIARRAVDADVARTGIADLGRIELAAER